MALSDLEGTSSNTDPELAMSLDDRLLAGFDRMLFGISFAQCDTEGRWRRINPTRVQLLPPREIKIPGEPITYPKIIGVLPPEAVATFEEETRRLRVAPIYERALKRVRELFGHPNAATDMFTAADDALGEGGATFAAPSDATRRDFEREFRESQSKDTLVKVVEIYEAALFKVYEGAEPGPTEIAYAALLEAGKVVHRCD